MASMGYKSSADIDRRRIETIDARPRRKKALNHKHELTTFSQNRPQVARESLKLSVFFFHVCAKTYFDPSQMSLIDPRVPWQSWT
eukprot:715202-Pleurochrysis_carterae.AAC.1